MRTPTIIVIMIVLNRKFGYGEVVPEMKLCCFVILVISILKNSFQVRLTLKATTTIIEMTMEGLAASWSLPVAAVALTALKATHSSAQITYPTAHKANRQPAVIPCFNGLYLTVPLLKSELA